MPLDSSLQQRAPDQAAATTTAGYEPKLIYPLRPLRVLVDLANHQESDIEQEKEKYWGGFLFHVIDLPS